MTDTRHLDTALAILRGTPKKARRSGTVITVYDLGSTGASVQVNQKEVWLAPNRAAAIEDAYRRADRLRSMGRDVTVEEF